MEFGDGPRPRQFSPDTKAPERKEPVRKTKEIGEIQWEEQGLRSYIGGQDGLCCWIAVPAGGGQRS